MRSRQSSRHQSLSYRACIYYVWVQRTLSSIYSYPLERPLKLPRLQPLQMQSFSAGLIRSLLISTVIREELVGPDQVCQSSDNSAINESLSASEVKVFTFSLLMVVILSSFLLVPRVGNSAMLHAVVSDVAHVLAVLHAPKFLADTVTS